MTTLFSPVGTADPITQLGDGPMIHIIRMYKPDEIYLFLSPLMGRLQDGDRRYTRAIELLCERTGQLFPDVNLIRSDGDVHRFDLYIAEFDRILKKLTKKYGGEPLLVNVSSGTPQMEQALVAHGAFGKYDLRLLQVPTPRGDTSEKEDREKLQDYDLDALWELNPDNEGDIRNRVEEVSLPRFKDELLRDNVRTLVRCYDYTAASELAKQSDSMSPDLKNCIQGLVDRVNLRSASRHEPIAEYLYVMEVRLKQGNWADFCRMLTPALTYTIERVLEPYLSKDKYLDGNDFSRLDSIKIGRDGKLNRVLGRFIGGNEPHYVTNSSLAALVGEFCSDDKAKRQLLDLRKFEKDARNDLAHRIVAINKEQLEKKGGMRLEDVMSQLFELNGVEPGLYEKKNEELIRQL